MNLDNYPLYLEAYKLLRMTIGRLNCFPRAQRFGLAQRIQSLELLVLEMSVEAIYYPNHRRVCLIECNKNVAILRILWRLSCDQGYVNHNGYGATISQLEIVGRMAGGWLKKLSTTSSTQEGFS